MHSVKCTLTIFITLLIIFSGSSSLAADWPMWRHDAARSAVTTEQLPAQLHLQWVHQLAKPKPAWPDNQYKLQFDMSYEPVVSGGKMFVNSMVSDSLTAYDTLRFGDSMPMGRYAWRRSLTTLRFISLLMTDTYIV